MPESISALPHRFSLILRTASATYIVPFIFFSLLYNFCVLHFTTCATAALLQFCTHFWSLIASHSYLHYSGVVLYFFLTIFDYFFYYPYIMAHWVMTFQCSVYVHIYCRIGIKLTCTTEWDTSSYLAKRNPVPQIVKWPRIFAVGLSKRRFLQDQHVPATSDFISPTLHNLAAQLFFFSPIDAVIQLSQARHLVDSVCHETAGRAKWGWCFSSPRPCRAFFSPLPTDRDENLGPERLLLDFKSSQTWMDVKGGKENNWAAGRKCRAKLMTVQRSFESKLECIFGKTEQTRKWFWWLRGGWGKGECQATTTKKMI